MKQVPSDDLDAAPCRDPQYDPEDWFLGEYGGHDGRNPSREVLKVKARCTQQCPLALKCHDWALSEGIPHGIFGGHGGRDRRHIWKTNREAFPHGRPQRFDRIMDSLLPNTNSSAVGTAAQRARRRAEREAS